VVKPVKLVKRRGFVPGRGDLVWLSFDPPSGHEQHGRRPALVLSPIAYNRRVGLALVCPVTSRSKGYPFEVALPQDLPVAGVVLADHMRSVDWRSRRAEWICALPDDVTLDALERLGALLDPAQG
jgi:mRNA interferase MazF